MKNRGKAEAKINKEKGYAFGDLSLNFAAFFGEFLFSQISWYKEIIDL
jgi:hypothetical protein